MRLYRYFILIITGLLIFSIISFVILNNWVLFYYGSTISVFFLTYFVLFYKSNKNNPLWNFVAFLIIGLLYYLIIPHLLPGDLLNSDLYSFLYGCNEIDITNHLFILPDYAPSWLFYDENIFWPGIYIVVTFLSNITGLSLLLTVQIFSAILSALNGLLLFVLMKKILKNQHLALIAAFFGIMIGNFFIFRTAPQGFAFSLLLVAIIIFLNLNDKFSISQLIIFSFVSLSVIISHHLTSLFLIYLLLLIGLSRFNFDLKKTIITLYCTFFSLILFFIWTTLPNTHDIFLNMLTPVQSYLIGFTSDVIFNFLILNSLIISSLTFLLILGFWILKQFKDYIKINHLFKENKIIYITLGLNIVAGILIIFLLTTSPFYFWVPFIILFGIALYGSLYNLYYQNFKIFYLILPLLFSTGFSLLSYITGNQITGLEISRGFLLMGIFLLPYVPTLASRLQKNYQKLCVLIVMLFGLISILYYNSVELRPTYYSEGLEWLQENIGEFQIEKVSADLKITSMLKYYHISYLSIGWSKEIFTAENLEILNQTIDNYKTNWNLSYIILKNGTDYNFGVYGFTNNITLLRLYLQNKTIYYSDEYLTVYML